MDNQATESSSLNVDGAAQAFSAFFDGSEPVEKSAQDLEKEVLDDLTSQKSDDDNAEVKDQDEPKDDEKVTIEVDGKPVELSKAELADYYKNGLRQSDYTKKTMEVAEQRKAAEAEHQKAVQERMNYAQNLAKVQAQLEGALNEQNNIDWNGLLEADPIEYMRQQHLLQQRQAAYQRGQAEMQQLEQIHAEEQANAQKSFLAQQQELLLAKLPDWKDQAKAKSEGGAIAKYLQDSGFDQSQIQNITDHRLILLARDAMLYKGMMNKANAASKKVAAVPQKVLSPSSGESPNVSDKRTQGMRQLAKSGRVEDAASLFAQIL